MVIEELGGKLKMSQPKKVDMMQDEEMNPKRNKKKHEGKMNNELKVTKTSLKSSPNSI